MEYREFAERYARARDGEVVTVDLGGVTSKYMRALAAYQDFVRSTGTCSIIYPDGPEPVRGITEATHTGTCSYCQKKTYGLRCGNCGARV